MTEQIKLFNAVGEPLYTSAQVAGRMGISRASLITLLSRNPQLRPAIKVGADLFWSEGEKSAAENKKATGKRRRPAKD